MTSITWNRSRVLLTVLLAVGTLLLVVLAPMQANAAARSGGASAIAGANKMIAFGGTCAENPSRRGTNTTICHADDANMDYCTNVPWDGAYGHPFVAAMNTLDAQTDMYDTYSASCGTQTDIGGHLNVSKEIRLTNTSIRGIALCTKPIGGWGRGVCDQGSLVVNTALLGTGAQYRKTLCHEIGHFAGLHHFSAPAAIANSCMVSGSATQSGYSAAERQAINGRY